jgi:acetyl esterase/lipase
MKTRQALHSIAGLAIAATLATTSLGQEPKAKAKGKAGPPQVPPDVKVMRDLDYVGNGLQRQRLDLYLPEQASGLLPLVVWVHGGGWQANSKDNCVPALPLPARGYALASINYRLTDAGPFPLQIEDCRAAVRWLRANASKYHLDPDHIGVWGPSAGGHLAALLGTAADEKQWDNVGGNTSVSTRVQAVCDYYGPTDFLAAIRAGITDGSDAKLLGGDPKQKLDVARAASPVAYVSKDDPPFLIVQGDKDPTVPLEQSQILYGKLKEAGVEATLLVVKNGKHGGWGPEVEPSPQQIRETVIAFFDKHLKNGKGKPPGEGGSN